MNLGFVYIGNSTVSNGGFRFTTPWLNERVQDYTLTYQDDKKTFRIVDRHLANGYICHVTEGDFQGNILGMENRVVTESAKYDGDYNDILCMIESNLRTIAPARRSRSATAATRTPRRSPARPPSGFTCSRTIIRTAAISTSTMRWFNMRSGITTSRKTGPSRSPCS